MSNLTVHAAYESSVRDLAALLTRAFSNYIRRGIVMDGMLLSRMIAADHIDLSLSQVVLQGHLPVGLALIARRGCTSRVAAMGIVPEAQGQRIGTWLLNQVIEQARARGDRTLTLEVIEQNTYGVRLYEAAGMKPIRRLYGFLGAGLAGEAAPLESVEPYEVARRMTALSASDLPWQCSGETLATQGTPNVGFRLDDAYALITNPAADTITIRGLVVAPGSQRRGQATRLVAALLAAQPGKTWGVPAYCPEEYGEIFVRNGFSYDTINQFQMIVRLQES
ncbi:MAG: GNAT family N-acetyltransferase [Anaerolineae bacterium]|nr:GNAT family N-acetyltransferase [Anaerolineae bacterium]